MIGWLAYLEVVVGIDVGDGRAQAEDPQNSCG